MWVVVVHRGCCREVWVVVVQCELLLCGVGCHGEGWVIVVCSWLFWRGLDSSGAVWVVDMVWVDSGEVRVVVVR